MKHKQGEKSMKKLARNKSSAFRGVFAIVTLAVFWITMAPFCAEAALQGSAGNTIIRNRVTVAYKDNNGVVQTPVTASVDITVTTVAAAPTVLSFTPSPGSTDGTGATQAYTVWIRTNSNGPGAITFNTADGTFTNIAAGTAPNVPGAIFLGSTVIDPTDGHIGIAQTVANGANIIFNVPNDGGVPTDAAVSGGATGDLVINALKLNDIVYIYSGTTYYGPFTVGTVTDPAVGAGTTAAFGSVQLINNTGSPIGPFTPAYGWEILEAKSVIVTVTQGAVTDPTIAASWVTTVTATMSGQNGTGNVTTNAHSGKLTVLKEVSTDGTTWATSGVSAAPSASLFYRITVTNTGLGNATTVVLTDPQPVYTTYTGGSAKRATGAAVSYAAAPTTLTDLNAADDGYDFGVTTALVATYSIGTIAPGAANAVQLFFKVTVN
jgi:hypothetical protein